ncbi:MAG: apolipoprotein N-acyltransferase [Candidatus Cloacimonetes bacterium]|nr:apolipoprotein N-acyltransferase [Candidatus Cloacimonadota bacterium]
MNKEKKIYKLKYSPHLAAILSGLMIAFSMPGYNLNLLAWFGLIPLLFALKNKTPKQALKLGLITGLSAAVIIFHYIFPISIHFIGKNSLWGVFGLLFIIFYYALWFGLISYFYTKVISNKKKIPFFLNLIIFPSIWISFEWIHSILLKGVHWTFFFLGYSQWENPYLLQLSSIFGVFGISFIIVLFNYLIFISIEKKNIKFASLGIIIFIIVNLTGYFIKIHRESEKGRQIKVSILQENIDALTRWDKATGDSLANVFLSLCQQASTQDPDLIVWSETAIPWTFRVDDHLIKKALEITNPTNAGHIIGIVSETEQNPENVYNSAFYFHPDGRATERYDKTLLISFLEAPLFDWSFFKLLKLPIYRAGLNKNLVPGERQRLMKTPYGKAGILICNESALISPARTATKDGADFLITMSNDSWLENTIYSECHFVISLFRAVENGRDMIINSNRGFSASISSSGRINKRINSQKPQCISTEIYTKKVKTIYSRFGDWLPIWCVIFILYVSLIKKKNINEKINH